VVRALVHVLPAERKHPPAGLGQQIGLADVTVPALLVAMKRPSVDFDGDLVLGKCDIDPEALATKHNWQVADPSGDPRLIEQFLAATLGLRLSSRTALPQKSRKLPVCFVRWRVKTKQRFCLTWQLSELGRPALPPPFTPHRKD